MKLRWLAVVLVLTVCSLSLSLKAATVVRLDLDGLVQASHTIVLGAVESSEPYWTPDGRLILTRTTIRIGETLKGTDGRTIEITTMGGTIGDTTLHVAGMPVFFPNEEAVVFVEDTGAYRVVVGLGQGKFSIGGGMVANNISNLEFAGGAKASTTRMSLELLLTEIRSRVQGF